MLLKVPALASFLASTCFATATGALELKYMSHLPLHLPEIGLTEPSGLAVDPDGSGFWIVSDETKTVFRLDADGEIRPFLGRDDRMRDLEGVAVDTGKARLLAVSERTSSIIVVSLDPPHRLEVVELGALPTPTNLADALQDHDNGLEGIAVDQSTGSVFVLKERDPRLLVEIVPTLDRVISVRNLDSLLPDDEDVSGLALDTVRDGFWIVSDVGKSVYFLPFEGNSVVTLDLYWRDKDRKRKLDNAEGAALSPDGRYLFVISDDNQSSRLVQYEIIDDKAHSNQ
jgi:uncharacterized protein YjiK